MEKESKTKVAVAASVATIAGIIIGIALSAIGFNHWEKKQDRTVSTTIVTRHDTTYHSFAVQSPAPAAEVIVRHDTIYIDTSRVIDDYFTERDYCIDFTDDSASATLRATVVKNALRSSTLDIRCQSATTTVTNTIETFVPKTPLWGLGVGAGVSYFILSRKVGINLALSLDYKRNTFLIHYDPINCYAGIGYRYQVWQSKK